MSRAMTVGAVLIACLSLAGCGANEDEIDPPRPVLSIIAEPETTGTLRLVGTVEPQVRAALGFRVLGRLVAREVSVGDFVEKGQQVAAIDPTSFELAMRSVLADLSSARAQLANAANAADRQQALRETSASTAAHVEAAQEQLQMAQATVDQAEANRARAAEHLGHAQLRAEFDGVVTAVSAEIGQVVLPGETVVTIAQPEIREAVVDIPESAASGLRKGERFDVALELDPTIRAEGSVREVAPQADPATRTRRVRITLAQPTSAFRLGTTVIVMRRAGSRRLFVLPSSAVLDRDGRSLVWIVDERLASVSLREVSMAAHRNGAVAIDHGLESGERVVTAGVHSLTEGQKVLVSSEPSQ